MHTGIQEQAPFRWGRYSTTESTDYRTVFEVVEDYSVRLHLETKESFTVPYQGATIACKLSLICESNETKSPTEHILNLGLLPVAAELSLELLREFAEAVSFDSESDDFSFLKSHYVADMVEDIEVKAWTTIDLEEWTPRLESRILADALDHISALVPQITRDIPQIVAGKNFTLRDWWSEMHLQKTPTSMQPIWRQKEEPCTFIPTT